MTHMPVHHWNYSGWTIAFCVFILGVGTTLLYLITDQSHADEHEKMTLGQRIQIVCFVLLVGLSASTAVGSITSVMHDDDARDHVYVDSHYGVFDHDEYYVTDAQVQAELKHTYGLTPKVFSNNLVRYDILTDTSGKTYGNCTVDVVGSKDNTYATIEFVSCSTNQHVFKPKKLTK